MFGIFVDIETSGLDPYSHAPLEIGIILVDLFSGKELFSYSRFVKTSEEVWKRSDPQALHINGISFSTVNQGSLKDEIAKEIIELFREHSVNRDRAFFICQNPSFDRPFFSQIIPQYQQEHLNWPYHWLDLASMYWALFACKEQKTHEFSIRLSKDTIAKALTLPPEETPHKAIRGVRHLIQCYEKLVGFPDKV